jgi:hypothetical protein
MKNLNKRAKSKMVRRTLDARELSFALAPIRCQSLNPRQPPSKYQPVEPGHQETDTMSNKDDVPATHCR